MENPSRQKVSSEKRLDRARAHVNDLWFPVNEALLGKIRTGLSKGEYDARLDLLVQEIKGDFSLFTYCLKELARMLKTEGTAIPAPNDPLLMLEQAGLERLKEILSIDAAGVSRHTFDGVTQLQAMRFQETMISATTAEMLAVKERLEPNVVYSTAVLRQLGITLIAFNYPSVYQRAVATLNGEDSLDLKIAEQLGFTPTSLAISLTRDWGLAPEIQAALGEDEEQDGLSADEVRGIADTIAQLCMIGEALARANHPEHYPSAKEDWALAKKEIEAKLGSAGLKEIGVKIEQNCAHYIKAVPQIFKGGLVLDPEAKIKDYQVTESVRRNPFLYECRPHLRKKLLALYETLVSRKVVKDNLNSLVRDIIPAANFTGGCVFTVDPPSGMLIPQMEIGVLRLRKMQPISASRYAPTEDMVAQAFQEKVPVVKCLRGEDDSQLACLAGIIGFSQRVGVLYLELPEVTFKDSDTTHLTHFKAISQALNDCLGLS